MAHVPQHLASPPLHPIRSSTDEASWFAAGECAGKIIRQRWVLYLNHIEGKETRDGTHLLNRAAHDVPHHLHLVLLPQTPGSANSLFLYGRVPQRLQNVHPGRSSNVQSSNVGEWSAKT